MLKQFIKDSFIYTIGNILIRGVSYLLLPFYTSALSPTDYGLTDILLVFTSFVCISVALEITQGVAIYYANSESQSEKILYASTALWFGMAAYTVFGIVCLIFASPISEILLRQPDKSLIFSFSVISTWGYGMSYLASNQLRWERKPQKYAFTGLLTSFVTIGSTIIFVLFLNYGANGVVAGQMLGNMSGSLLAIYFGKAFYAFRFDFHKLKQMLAFSIPLVPSSVGIMVMLYINRVAINSIMTLADVGIYGLAFRITAILEIIMMGFRTALTPLIYNNYQNEETPGEIARIFRYFVAFALLIILFLSSFAHEIVVLLSQPSYYGAATIIAILAPAYVLSQMNIFTLGWAIVKKTKSFAIINIVGAFLAIILNFSLIPLVGISGAAWANLIVYMFTFLSSMTLSQKYYYVPHKWKNIISAVVVFILLFFGGTYFIPQFDLIMNGLIKLSFMLVGIVFLFQFGLIDMKDIKMVIKGLRLLIKPGVS